MLVEGISEVTLSFDELVSLVRGRATSNGIDLSDMKCVTMVQDRDCVVREASYRFVFSSGKVEKE